MKLETLRYGHQDGVARITLNRPERLNAFNQRLIGEMGQLLDSIAADDTLGAVVIDGAGRAFSSGFDLKDDAAAERSGAAAWREALQTEFDFLFRFWDFPKPTIAAVHGYCLAGGCELAMSCDVTIAAEGTHFGEPELRFGTVITNLIMPWLVGPKLAKELLLSGEDRLSAERAERIGLVNRVVLAGAHVEEAMSLGRRMARVDRQSARLTKQAINRTFEIMGLREALRAGLDTAVQLESMETPSRTRFREIARTEGLKAALAWRDARFEASD